MDVVVSDSSCSSGSSPYCTLQQALQALQSSTDATDNILLQVSASPTPSMYLPYAKSSYKQEFFFFFGTKYRRGGVWMPQVWARILGAGNSYLLSPTHRLYIRCRLTVQVSQHLYSTSTLLRQRILGASFCKTSPSWVVPTPVVACMLKIAIWLCTLRTLYFILWLLGEISCVFFFFFFFFFLPPLTEG